MKRSLLGVLLLVSLGGLGGHYLLQAQSGLSTPPPPPAPSAEPDEVAANGIVEGARPEVGLRPEVAGTLARVHVVENQVVKRGELLAELHNDTQRHQIALARAELDLAKAQLERLRNGELPEKRKALAAIENAKQRAYEHAKGEFERSRNLSQGGAAGREQAERDRFRMLTCLAELEQAQAERALIEAPARPDEVAIAEARVAAAQARLHLAEAELAKTRLQAPADGCILQVFAEAGETAGPTSPQPVLLLADLSRRRVRAFVEEYDAARVRPGQTAVVTADALPQRQFYGRVAVVLSRMGKRAPQSDEPGEYKDVYFREVLIDLEAAEELPLNLRVLARLRGTAPEINP